MSSAPSPRHLRTPVPQDLFNQKTLVTRSVEARQWVNLRWEKHANAKHLYFASESGRLTPAAGKVPCIYISPTENTAFRELYGDRIHEAHENRSDPFIQSTDFTLRVFLSIEMPALVLVDLTTGDGLEAVDLDLGTLYSPDPTYPRAFAQAIAEHPAHVDGILYESRHTKEHCAVVWAVHRPVLAEVNWSLLQFLESHVDSLHGSNATVFGTKFVVAS